MNHFLSSEAQSRDFPKSLKSHKQSNVADNLSE